MGTILEPDLGGVLPVSLRRRAYAAVMLGTVMSTLDSSIANIALPTIGRELHASPAATVWVANAFQLAVVASLFTLGSLGESRGVTRMWRFGVVLFTLSSLACALSHTFEALIISRIGQGIGAAFSAALAPAMVRDIYPRSRLGHAFGLNAMYTSVAAAGAPTLGGFILAFLPWQWLFALNLPICAVALILQRGAVPDVPGTKARLDIPSAVASAFGFAMLVYGLDGLARGDSQLVVVLELLLGGTVFGWFIRRQFVLPQPLIALDLFRLPRFAVGCQASFCTWAAWSTAIITLPFLLQLDFGLTPFQSGLAMSSFPLATAVVAMFAGRFADRYAVAMLATGGLIVMTFGLALLAYAVLHPNLTLVIVASGVCGGAFGFFQTPNNREIMGSGPPEKGGSVSAIFASMRVGGQTFGATLVAIAFATFAPSITAHVATGAVHAAVLAALAVGILLALVAIFVSGQRALRDGFAYQTPHSNYDP